MSQSPADPAQTRVSATTEAWRVDDAGIDAFELAASRRALANLRTLLYGEKMDELVKEQVEVAEKQFRAWYDASGGTYRGGQVLVRITGLTTRQLIGNLMRTLGAAQEEGEARRAACIAGVFPAHPEHYGLSLQGPGGIETMGGMPTLTFPAYVADDEVPDFIAELVDPAYTLSKVGRGLLADGTVQSWVLQEFRDVDDGLEASLRVWYPSACPDEVVAEHLQHYAVEFRNGARLAAAESAAS